MACDEAFDEDEAFESFVMFFPSFMRWPGAQAEPLLVSHCSSAATCIHAVCVVHRVEHSGQVQVLISVVVFEEGVCQTMLATSQ